MLDAVDGPAGNPPADLKRGRRKPAPDVDLSRVDRLPPHSLEAEQGVLGCLLADPRLCIPLAVERLKGSSAAFYELRHQAVFDTMVEMHERLEGVDLITTRQRLKDKGQLEAIGGVAYLTALLDATPSPANLAFYLDIVRDKHLLRRMIQTCGNVVNRIFDHEMEGDVKTLLDEAETELLRAGEDRAESATQTIKSLVQKAIVDVERFYEQRGQGGLTGLASGFADFDRLTTGMHPGEMIVIAARPSMGKTAIAMNIAEHVALDQRVPVGVFSLEMAADSLVLRMLCSRAKVNLRSVRDGFIAERDFPKLTREAGRLSAAPLFIDDTGGLTIMELRAKARRMSQQHGIRLFVIDYLQLLRSPSRRADNRQQEIAEISSGVKALAKELKVPIVVLSQLNRDVEKREPGAKPRMSDLRESGSIEQDADLIGLLYKPNAGEEEDGVAPDHDDPGGVPVNLLIAKQRNGPTGDVPLVFLKSFTRFEGVARVSPDDMPNEQPDR